MWISKQIQIYIRNILGRESGAHMEAMHEKTKGWFVEKTEIENLMKVYL